jgi:anti-anti-sigma factor
LTQNEENPNKTHTVIIDCSPISYIDSSGVGTIEEVVRELKLIGINVVLASCNEVVLQMFDKTQFYDRFAHNVYIYASVHDAVISSLSTKL